MGVAIVNHIWFGHDVHVVMYTNGFPSTSATNKLNNDLQANGFGPLTKAEIVAVRTDEFYRSCLALGVTHDNIHIDFASSVNKDGVKDIVMRYEALLDSPNHKAMSRRDIAASHAISGEALKELHDAGLVKSSRRFYIRHIQMDNNKSWGFRRESSRI